MNTFVLDWSYPKVLFKALMLLVNIIYTNICTYALLP